ncbi:hypothetical protein SAMN06265375_101272 [Muriicola jejuensis]|nr:hypothetical protein SAMN06265375_101272 [Muriicola jejuensis]
MLYESLYHIALKWAVISSTLCNIKVLYPCKDRKKRAKVVHLIPLEGPPRNSRFRTNTPGK